MPHVCNYSANELLIAADSSVWIDQGRPALFSKRHAVHSTLLRGLRNAVIDELKLSLALLAEVENDLHGT